MSQEKQTWTQWGKQKYNNQYESWMPWIEDNILSYFGENKASYATKDQLNKTKITGDKNIDAIQDGVNQGVGGQLGKGGLLEPVGKLVSKEGANRYERGGKNDKGTFT